MEGDSKKTFMSIPSREGNWLKNFDAKTHLKRVGINNSHHFNATYNIILISQYLEGIGFCQDFPRESCREGMTG